MYQQLIGLKTFSKKKVNLENIKIFHTDCGSEFETQIIKRTLNVFNIKRSLCMKSDSYDVV
jgi:hypothetical protein